MAAAHSTSKGHSGRNRGPKQAAGAPGRRPSAKQTPGQAEASTRGSAPPIRGRLREFLESEQEFLIVAESLFLCIARSMNDREIPNTGPYYPDALKLAAGLIRRRAANIDEFLSFGRLRYTQGLGAGRVANLGVRCSG
jgi:hypothetical protein